MSLTQKSQSTKSKKTIQSQGGVIKLIHNLTEKVRQLEQSKQSNTPQNVRHLERKMTELEQKNRSLELSIREIKNKPTSSGTSGNSREIKILNNIVNEDLNKIKLKLEKHEDLIKKILFN